MLNPVLLAIQVRSLRANGAIGQKTTKNMPRSVTLQSRRGPAVKRSSKWRKGTTVPARTSGRSPKTPSKKDLHYAYIRPEAAEARNSAHCGSQRINAGAREHGMSYSTLMGSLSKKGIELNRKVLADLAMNHPEAFKAVVDQAK